MTRLLNQFPYTKAKEEQSKRLTKGEKKSNQENNISKLWGPVRHLNSNRSIRARGLHQQARGKGRRASEQPINKVLRLAHLLITPLCRSSKDSRSPTHAMGCSAECSKVSSSISWPLPCCKKKKDRFREKFLLSGPSSESSTVQQEIVE